MAGGWLPFRYPREKGRVYSWPERGHIEQPSSPAAHEISKELDLGA